MPDLDAAETMTFEFTFCGFAKAATNSYHCVLQRGCRSWPCGAACVQQNDFD
jgi:hypothetical protein